MAKRAERRKRRDFSVLESRWYQNEVSVKPLYDFLCDARNYGRGAYIYERFFSAKSLAELLKFVTEKESACFLYIGTHGVARQLKFPDSSLLDAAGLWRRIQSAGARPEGLFLSTCGFLTEKNAKALLIREARGTSLRWVAGYQKDVDWLQTAFFEAMFFDQLFGGETESGEEIPIEDVARHFRWDGDWFAKNSGFNIFVRKPRGKGEITNLTALPQA